MDKKYISPNGLRQVWGKINEVFAKKTELPDVDQFMRKDDVPDMSGIVSEIDHATDNTMIAYDADSDEISVPSMDEFTELKEELSQKQDKLTSGSTIKTINGIPVLGSGNISIQGGSDSYDDWDVIHKEIVETELENLIISFNADDNYRKLKILYDHSSEMSGNFNEVRAYYNVENGASYTSGYIGSTMRYFDIDIILSKNYCGITAFSSRNIYLSLYGYAGAGKNTGQTIDKAFNDTQRPVGNKGFYQFGMYFAIPVGARIMILGKKA